MKRRKSSRVEEDMFGFNTRSTNTSVTPGLPGRPSYAQGRQQQATARFGEVQQSGTLTYGGRGRSGGSFGASSIPSQSQGVLGPGSALHAGTKPKGTGKASQSKTKRGGK